MMAKISWILKNWKKAMLLLEILELVAEATEWEWDDHLIQGIKDFLPKIVRDFSTEETKDFKNHLSLAKTNSYAKAVIERKVKKHEGSSTRSSSSSSSDLSDYDSYSCGSSYSGGSDSSSGSSSCSSD